MNEVSFSLLYYTVMELAHKRLADSQIKLVRDLRQFARVNGAVPTLDTSVYCISYTSDLNEFIVVQKGNTFSPNVVYFSDKEIAYRALGLYKKDMEHILELTDIVGLLDTNLVMVEDNSPFTKSELIDLYDKLSRVVEEDDK